jgi:hypothetical protein
LGKKTGGIKPETPRGCKLFPDVGGAVVSGVVVRFPPRRTEAVFLFPDELGGTYVVVLGNAWLFGSRREAEREAHALARDHRLPVREVAA